MPCRDLPVGYLQMYSIVVCVHCVFCTWAWLSPSLQAGTGMRRRFRLAQGQNSKPQHSSVFSGGLLEMHALAGHISAAWTNGAAGLIEPGRRKSKSQSDTIYWAKTFCKIQPDCLGYGFDLSKGFPLQLPAASGPFPFRFLV